MATSPQIMLDRAEKRLHLHFGPIDLIIIVDAPEEVRAKAHRGAIERFDGLLEQLVEELDILRRPFDDSSGSKSEPLGPVAKRMTRAILPHSKERYITPMAAVAGAVADEIGQAIAESETLPAGHTSQIRRWMVNNGGDIAIGLAPGQTFQVGLALCQPTTEFPTSDLAGSFQISAQSGVGGIATSGRHGRSLSLGIADSVTVLARSAAVADAAATIIANCVDLPGNMKIQRQPANEVDSESDLGELAVVVSVERLDKDETDQALARGLRVANQLASRQTIAAASIHLGGRRVATTPNITLNAAPSSRSKCHSNG